MKNATEEKDMGDEIIQEKKKLVEKIISYGQLILLLSGIIILIVSHKFSMGGEWKDILDQIGGIFISTGLVTMMLEKHKDKIKEEYIKKWLEKIKCEVGKSKYERINVLKKQQNTDIFIEFHDKEILHVVARTELDKDVNYKFLSLTEKVIKEKNKYPILIYGTTLGFLKEENKENREAVYNAICQGVDFRFVLVDPDSPDAKEHKKEDDVKDVLAAIQGVIEDIVKNKISDSSLGSIEVRITPFVERNSFSSFICENRRITVLDFNFEGKHKISQIFDEKFLESTSSCDKDQLALELTKHYIQSYKRGIPTIVFPPIYVKIYIIGLIPQGTENAILFVNDKNTDENEDINNWSLPVVEINDTNNMDISDFSKDKFTEITKGYKIQFYEMLPPLEKITKETSTIFFIGKIKYIPDFPYFTQEYTFSEIKKHHIFEKMTAEDQRTLAKICKSL